MKRIVFLIMMAAGLIALAACEEITNLIPHIRWLSEKAVLR